MEFELVHQGSPRDQLQTQRMVCRADARIEARSAGKVDDRPIDGRDGDAVDLGG
ncbi:hypothetical protein [Dietzia kunjamensis]|uniref:hypothetical protein n=1 Tax=Dietzia kunjamensis TaxID=322509 RepID=UPI00209745AA|nr:hypothetical protein [Dietzia kunjamensis]USX45089.1 hypothetical protein NHB83_12675 [Dietzia kunjamensis]